MTPTPMPTTAPAAWWDPLQCEMLQAMALTPFRHAPAASAAPEWAMVDAASVATAPARHDTAPAADALLQAVLRAAGGDLSADALARQIVLPPMEALRGDVAAKRALWPQLRALRRPPRA